MLQRFSAIILLGTKTLHDGMVLQPWNDGRITLEAEATETFAQREDAYLASQ